MKHAKKILLPFDIQELIGDIDSIDDRYTDSFGKFKTEYKIKRRFVPKKIQLKILKSLPYDLQKDYLTSTISEIGLLAPHVHITDNSVINFYIKTNKEITYFWDGEIVPDDYNSIVRDNGNGYWTLATDKLTICESFTADPGEIWILNTQQPHSVTFENFDFLSVLDTRLVIQMFFKTPFLKISSYFNQG
ncbi:MAG: hypothetical protein EBT86_00615 [Actinobacteria bacterium]|nr:hypothetical protein [Actinomycetota bacterium]